MPLKTRVGVFALLLATTIFLQWSSGSYEGGFGRFADEASHFVTGLMVRDYVANLAPAPPMEYAREYYAHYPRVGLGHWPPAFYLVQTLFTLVLPPTQPVLMLMMSLITGMLAYLVVLAVAPRYGNWIGVGAGVFVLGVPVTQQLAGVLMAEMLVALLVLLAMLCWVRYLNEPSWRWSLGFALLASAALLTKGTGVVLALFVPLSILLSGRIRLLKKPSFWAPAAIVPLLCGPWYLLAPGAMHNAAAGAFRLIGSGRPLNAISTFSAFLKSDIGIVATLLAAAGITRLVVLPWSRKQRPDPLPAAALAMVMALPLLAALIGPARPVRHALLVCAPLALLAAGGVAWGLELPPLNRLGRRRAGVLLGIGLAALLAVNAASVPPLPRRGFAAAASDLLARSHLRDSVFLVSSDGKGEGMFIAEIARREQRPGHYVAPGSKTLANSSFFGDRYRLRFPTPEQMMSFLRSVPIEVLVIDRSARYRFPHGKVLDEVLELYAPEWKLLNTYHPEPGPGAASGAVEAYQLVGQENRRPKPALLHAKPRFVR